MKYTMIILAILFLSAFSSLCLAGWERTYGFPWAHDLGAYVIQTSDKGYLITGTTDSIGGVLGTNLYLIKTDSLGNLMWNRTYGGTEDDAGQRVLPANGEGYYVIGNTRSYSHGDMDGWLLKINSIGDTLWTKSYGSTHYDLFADGDLCQNGLIVVGWSCHPGMGEAEAWIIKVDSGGDIIWSKEYGGSADECCHGVSTLKDDGFIVTGYTSSFGPGTTNVFNLRLDIDGDTIWTRTFGGYIHDMGYSVVNSPDSCFVITGYTNSFGPTSEDILLLKLDRYGETLWFHTYGTIENEMGYSISTTSDSGFVIVGFTSTDSTDDDIWLLKTDKLGDTLWTRTFGGVLWERAWCVKQTMDGGFIIVGQTSSFSATGDVYLIKTDSLGYTQIEETYSTKPEKIALSAYPNPFNSAVSITAPAGAEIVIFDVNGRMVGEITVGDGSPVPSANGRGDLAPTEIIWQPNENICSGVYLVKASIGDSRAESKIVFVK